MTTVKKLPIGIQTFKTIREENYAYVDKTDLAVQLINQYRYVFLSRPRRFGKSLFVDTLHQLLAGNKELFQGLAAEREHDWSVSYPVIKIDLSEGSFSNGEELQQSLTSSLQENEQRLGVTTESTAPTIRFAQLIRQTSRKYNSPVAILIDEYDKPILDNIICKEEMERTRDSLRSFYSSIKSNDAHIRFAFLTGVSRFSRVSIFSGINNIEDISLTPQFATICGYKAEDLTTLFSDYLQDVDFNMLKLWYDGYNFLGEHVYNPFDILLFIRGDKQFKNYWFETGTPTFLVKLIQEKRFFLPQLDNIKAGDELLSSFDIDNITPVPLLFQTGYLTIKEVLQEGVLTQYTLGFPNLEVSAAFNNSLLDIFISSEDKFNLQAAGYLALYRDNMEQFKEALYALFASISYHNYSGEEIAKYEGFYASVIYAWLASSRLLVKVEENTNKGRIDMVIEMEKVIYIIEFKVDISGEAAIKQIRDRAYPERYQSSGKKITLIGINFSSGERNITDFLCQEL